MASASARKLVLQVLGFVFVFLALFLNIFYRYGVQEFSELVGLSNEPPSSAQPASHISNTEISAQVRSPHHF
jgi:Na+-transporting methylmalonyl-CoA/oxaloacetate decarboxylase gamma subunit